jgi:hypothetical protein
MSAEIETIRRAAALMRERAEDASPGPWVGFAYPIDSDGEGGEVVVRDPDDFDVALMTSDQFDDCPHIASWHPVVALTVADWLDQTAGDWQLIEDGVLWSRAITWDATKVRALAVARTYLGESS